MTEQEDPRRKSRRDLLLVLLILPFGILCMFMTGQVAIKLAPEWVMQADMRSLLDPNATFVAQGIQPFIEPLNPAILTRPAWGDLFLTPNAYIPTRAVVTATPLPPERTPLPPPVLVTPVETQAPTATASGPIVIPTGATTLRADLKIEKSDNSATYTPGSSISYVIVVTNMGPDVAPSFNVTDNIPAVISGLSVNCTPADRCGTNTSRGNSISYSGASLYSGGAITISVNGTVAPGASGDLVNTASVNIPSGVRARDPNSANNTATDTDTQLSVYDLAINKSNNILYYTLTNPVEYTVTVTNKGPSDAIGVIVRDSRPIQITSWTWTCTTVTKAGRCNGGTSSSNFADTIDIQSGGMIVYTVTANLASLTQNPQNLTNTASINLPTRPGVMDPNLTDNSATHTDSPYIDLQITKDDRVTTYTPPGAVTYTITVANKSTFNLTGITVSDPKPPQISTWSWSCAGGCTPVVNSSSSFTDTISLAAGSNLVYTVTANTTLVTGAPELRNTASVIPPPGLVDATPDDNSATDIDALDLQVDLQVYKTDGVSNYTPGGTLQYRVTVTNNSAFELTGVSVLDNIPSGISSWSWTCAPAPGYPDASCTPGPNNTGINDTTVKLPARASVVYTIDAIVSQTASGTLENTATVSPPPGIVEAQPGDNIAVDTNLSGIEVDLQIVKDDGVSEYAPNTVLNYTILVTNVNSNGANLTGVRVTDLMPPATMISSWNWICYPTINRSGASCTNTSGAGDIDITVNLPANTSVTFEIAATVSSTARGDLTNTASVSPPAGYIDINTSNNVEGDTDSRRVEYVIGPPDGILRGGPASGEYIDFTLTTPIIIDGNPDFEIVLYEWEPPDQPGIINLDQVVILISTDGTTWYRVYYWGDNIPDTNASPLLGPPEPDNLVVPTSSLYGSPYQTGIRINADGGLDKPPNGTYPYLRVSAPLGDADGGCDIDTIGIWP